MQIAPGDVLSACAPVRSGSVPHSRPDPVASGLSGWYSTSCFRWENTRGIFGCLLISFESRAGRQENTHFQVLCEVISLHERTHARTRRTHTHMHTELPPFTPAYLFLVVCILLLSWRWHTSAGTHIHTRSRKGPRELALLARESFMLPSKSLFS